MQVSYFHLTSSIQAGKTVSFKCAPLRLCASLFSLRGRCQKVLYEQDNLIFKGLVVADQLSKPKPLTISQGIIIVAKIILIATLVVPLLALIGAKIFSAHNPIIYERQVKMINDMTAAIRKLEGIEERLGRMENEKNSLEKELKSELSQAKNKITRLGKQVKKLNSEVMNQANKIDTLNTRLQKLQKTRNTVLKSQSSESSNFVLESEDKHLASWNGFSSPIMGPPLPLSLSPSPSRPLSHSSSLSSNGQKEIVSQEKINTVERYLTVCGQTEDLSRIADKIKKGQEFYQSLVNQDQDKIEKFMNDWLSKNAKVDQKYMVACLLWFFMSKALVKGQGFTEGTFILPMMEGRLLEFFTRLTSTYFRESSSHLSQYQERHDETHKKIWGIDVKTDLPGGFHHVLIQVVARTPNIPGSLPKLLIKLEPHGTEKIMDQFMHGLSYGASQIKQRLGMNDGGPYARKERIPVREVEEFSKLVRDLPDGGAIIARVGADDKGEGIQAMVSYMNEKIKISEFSEDKKKEFQGFMNTLAERGYDHLEERFGREVILTQLELDSPDIVIPVPNIVLPVSTGVS